MFSSIRSKSSLLPPLQVSKWLKCPVLLNPEEMEALIKEMGDFYIFIVSELVNKNEEFFSPSLFMEKYRLYVNQLRDGKIPNDNHFRAPFSSIWTVTSEAVYQVETADGKMIRAESPVVQLQPHRFDFSAVDGKFRSMVFGLNSISWGIQFSYPQLYQDLNMHVKQVKETPEFPNTTLFKKIQRWVRENTVPVPFLVEGKRINVPFRLGKTCFEWINNHPQLTAKGLHVIEP